jgi:hypothetical protein
VTQINLDALGRNPPDLPLSIDSQPKRRNIHIQIVYALVTASATLSNACTSYLNRNSAFDGTRTARVNVTHHNLGRVATQISFGFFIDHITVGAVHAPSSHQVITNALDIFAGLGKTARKRFAIINAQIESIQDVELFN